MRIGWSREAIMMCGAAFLGTIAIGIYSAHLYAVTIALLTLAPMVSHARHVGVRQLLNEPSAITVIVLFYLFVFPLRGLVIALSGYNDLVFLRGPVTGGDLVSMLLLAATGTTVLVESYYFVYSRRSRQPSIAVEPAERHGAVVRLAALLTALSLAGLAGVIVEHGGVAGARATLATHSVAAALQGNTSVFGSAWALFSVPAVWCCAYVVFNAGSSWSTRRIFTVAPVIIIAAAIEIYGSRLTTLLGLIGVWVVYFYSGRRLPTRLILVTLPLAVLLSQPILSARQGADNGVHLPTVERYSRIAGYGVLDVALAIQSQPDQIRAQLRGPTRWLDLPAYFVPSKLWPGRPNLDSRRLGLYAARDVGTVNDQNSGLPSTYITEWWLLGSWPGAIIMSIMIGSALGWVVRRLTRDQRPSPAAVLSLAFVVTTAWTYYKDGDLLSTIVGQSRLAVYLALLLWATGVIGRRSSQATTL